MIRAQLLAKHFDLNVAPSSSDSSAAISSEPRDFRLKGSPNKETTFG